MLLESSEIVNREKSAPFFIILFVAGGHRLLHFLRMHRGRSFHSSSIFPASRPLKWMRLSRLAGWLAEDHQSWMQKKNGQKSRLLYPLSPFLCLIWLIDTWGKRERGERRRKNSFSHPKECNFSFLPLFPTSCSPLLFSHSRQQKKITKLGKLRIYLRGRAAEKKVNPRMIL